MPCSVDILGVLLFCFRLVGVGVGVGVGLGFFICLFGREIEEVGRRKVEREAEWRRPLNCQLLQGGIQGWGRVEYDHCISQA